MHKLVLHIENFIDWTGRAISWLVLFMVLITFGVAFLRYSFDIGWIALQDSISYMHAVVFLVGAAYTLKHNEHVRVDIFYSRLGDKGRAWIDFIGSLVILIPVMLLIIWTSWNYVTGSWHTLESSPETGGLPGLFLIKSFILIMAVLLIIQALALTLKSWLTLAGEKS